MVSFNFYSKLFRPTFENRDNFLPSNELLKVEFVTFWGAFTVFKNHLKKSHFTTLKTDNSNETFLVIFKHRDSVLQTLFSLIVTAQKP